ncbi:DUF2849 domain-containing protein [Roseicyclus sp. F158]|uniref:DUF2849 domain-containing protein n=1 Tax=Tropicimonas omnivorans TaxID=3075590 RepID=A0ABU3DE34_9RHOB|nr:DUF2849 domain-containing protein [Roseicyclus sp. F158]MDT0681981.1 DUF2849 domain-containing protein [Roseicyclus sp. F158]
MPPRSFSPKVVTANRLLEGDAVWLTPSGRWSPDMREADLIEDESRAAQSLAEAESQSGLVVGAYLADAKAGPDGPEPTHFREAFRARGPSNYRLGKQAELTAG